MTLTVPNPSNVKVSYDTRAEFQAASIPSIINYTLAEGLTYIRDASGTAVVAADGSKWSPLVGEATPAHFGAVGDGVTDDTEALTAWKDFIISSFGVSGGLTGALPVFDLGGKRYAISGGLSFTTDRGSILQNGTLYAIGSSWTGASDFMVEWDSAYGRIQNVRLHCDRLCSGLKVDAGRVKVFQTEVYEYIGHGILVPETSGPEVWINQCIIGELDVSYNLSLFSDNANYVGTGIEIRRSDCKVSDTTVRWTRCCYRATAGIQDIYNCHFYNGGVGVVQRNNNQIIDWQGSTSNELTISGLYHDNGYSEFVTDRVNINNVSVIQDSADMVPATTFKFFAYSSSTPTRVNLRGVEVRQWTVGAELVEFVNSGGNTWAPNYDILEAYFNSFVDANRNNFSLDAAAKPMFTSFQAHDDREFRFLSNGILTRLGFMDQNTTQDSMPYVGSFGDKLRLGAPNGTVDMSSLALRLLPQGTEPVSSDDYLLAMSNGTSSTNGFGTSGAGLYQKISGTWTKV